MRLGRRVIPKIAHELIEGLRERESIEVRDEQVEDAEIDIAAVMVQHLDQQDLLIEEVCQAMSKRGIGMERFAQVKKSVAEARKVKIGPEAMEDLCNQILQALFDSKRIDEIYAQDGEIRKAIKDSVDRFIHVSEEVDKEARARLKNCKEGTPEWEIEYPRIVAQIKRQKGLN